MQFCVSSCISYRFASGLLNFKRKVVKNLLGTLPASNTWIKFLFKSVTEITGHSATSEKASAATAGVQGRRGE